ncbi:Aldose_reductase [Hexamita inflata]|uniref:Aldose reductase n=1 Tax=Hexamita inflata TaxID=28002 RepID=A0AA86N8D0_9EUKA|nr:Aldose reductase [Hexamita inflata]
MQIQQIGFGTYMIPQHLTKECITEALKQNYTYFDCAYLYGNEKQIGEALSEHFQTNDRSKYFISTKLWNTNHTAQRVKNQLEFSLKTLQLDYLDLFLVHWPVPFDPVSLKETWQAMEACVDSGQVRFIGVSNYSAKLLSELLSYARIRPYTNQIEVHPFFQNRDLISFCHQNHIHVTAYSPLCGNYDNIPSIAELGEQLEISNMCAKYSRDPAQIILQWHLQHYPLHYSVVPKTQTIERIGTNKQIDFELTKEEMEFIDKLDANERGSDSMKLFGMEVFE